MSHLLRPLFWVGVVVTAALAVALVALPARASYPRVIYHQPYVPYVEKRIVVIDYLPPYPVGYATPYTPPAPQTSSHKTPCDAKIDALSAKIAALEAKAVQAPAPQTAPRMEKVEDVDAGLAVLQSRCASCHTGATSKKVDGRPVVIFSEPGALNPEADVLMMLLEIEDDHMAPGKPLSVEEKRAVRALMRAVAKK